MDWTISLIRKYHLIGVYYEQEEQEKKGYTFPEVIELVDQRYGHRAT
jgi:hypothetical protein